MVIELMGFFNSFCLLAQSCEFFVSLSRIKVPPRKEIFLKLLDQGLSVCVELR